MLVLKYKNKKPSETSLKERVYVINLKWGGPFPSFTESWGHSEKHPAPSPTVATSSLGNGMGPFGT